jgi:TolB-like protein
MESRPSIGVVCELFRFGPFEVSLRTGELRKRGIRIALQEQPRRILAALLEEPGEVVSREELRRRLWPQGTFVDFEHSLNAAVRRLRVTLGDEARVPRFIETVQRRGYRFLAVNEWFPRPTRPLDRLAPTATPALPSGRARLAVVPFGPTDKFSEGLTDETITQLTRLCPRHFGVIARTSVERAQQVGRSAAELGRALDAHYLVEGSVRRDGDRLRISAQLIDSQEETHLWAATFDRVLSDALTLQTELGDAIARAVIATLAGTMDAAIGF